MRLFVAVEVGPDVQRAAARVIDELKRRTERLAPRARVSWVKPERLHITVRFIGAVDAGLVPAIVRAFEPPLSTRAFDLTVATTGAFPPNRPARVLWAGLTRGLESMREVEREVGARLSSLGLAEEAGEYHPHLTLARLKQPAGLRAADVLKGLHEAAFGVVRVGAVTLFESRLTSEPAYVVLARTPLTP